MEGGYQQAGAWYGAYSQLAPHRLSSRCMYPWELLELLWRFKHPRFDSCGIESTIQGNYARKQVGIEAHGTVWFSKPHRRDWTYAIPCGCIPYSTIRTATWDEENGKFAKGKLLRGWRSLFELLLHQSYLSPSPELSYMIGKDSFILAPAKIRR